METKVILVENVYLTKRGKVKYDGLKLKFESLNECFNYLEKKGHPIAHNNFRPAEPIQTVRKDEKNIIVYEPRDTPNGAAKRLVNLVEAGASCYYIEQHRSCSENLPYEAFLKAHADWERAKIARKFFHPGSSLTLTFILIAIGLGLGAACPPALVFVALGVAAFSAISAIVYAADWLRRDWSVYKAITDANNATYKATTDTDKDTDEPSLRGYLENCWERLQEWIPNHKPQAIMMGIGAVVFLGALAVVAGHFIAIAITGAGFAFMTMGASGGALGLTGSFFAAGFGAISGLTSSVVAVLTSAFAAMALVLGPTNILDSIRRFFSWVTKEKESEPDQLRYAPIPPPLPPGGYVPKYKLQREESAALAEQVLQMKNLETTSSSSHTEKNLPLATVFDIGSQDEVFDGKTSKLPDDFFEKSKLFDKNPKSKVNKSEFREEENNDNWFDLDQRTSQRINDDAEEKIFSSWVTTQNIDKTQTNEEELQSSIPFGNNQFWSEEQPSTQSNFDSSGIVYTVTDPSLLELNLNG